MITLQEAKQNTIYVDATISALNIDDLFREVRGKGIVEIQVSAYEMCLIVQFLSANLKEKDSTSEMWREGKVDKFLGVSLFM